MGFSSLLGRKKKKDKAVDVNPYANQPGLNQPNAQDSSGNLSTAPSYRTVDHVNGNGGRFGQGNTYAQGGEGYSNTGYGITQDDPDEYKPYSGTYRPEPSLAPVKARVRHMETGGIVNGHVATGPAADGFVTGGHVATGPAKYSRAYDGLNNHETEEETERYAADNRTHLTDEQREDQETDTIKKETKHINKDTANMMDDALRIGYETLGTAIRTQEAVKMQGDSLNRTELHLAETDKTQKVAQVTTDHLRKEGRFGAAFIGRTAHRAKRAGEKDAVYTQELHEVRARVEDRQRADDFAIQRRELEAQLKDKPITARTGERKRGKYAFEQDSEDDEVEDRIESGAKELLLVVKEITTRGEDTGRRLEAQIPQIKGMADKADTVGNDIGALGTRLHYMAR